MNRLALAFSLTLLVAGPALAATQHDKMKSCNAEAAQKTLKGEERRKFMSECLSK